MTTKTIDQSVYKLVNFVLDARDSGNDDETIITNLLPNRFEGDEDRFRWAVEMINTGIFRASILSSGHSYPNSNFKIEDDDVLKVSFELHWVKLKGIDHYTANYVNNSKKLQLVNWLKGIISKGQ